MRSWLALVIGGVGAAALTLVVLTGRRGGLTQENFRGRAVPVFLGSALGLAAVIGALLGPWDDYENGAMVTGFLALAVVGHLDDRTRQRERGLRAHLRSLRHLRPTTGILKLVVGVVLAVVVAFLLGGGPVRIALAALTTALCTNLWNALDVRPGRALKWAILALAPVVAIAWGETYGIFGSAVLGGAIAVLPIDLTERAMLGDEGSNPLGFIVGVGLAWYLPTAGLAVAAGVAAGLQVAAETVTISRLIDAVPPLRWFDRLGRRREPEPAGS